MKTTIVRSLVLVGTMTLLNTACNPGAELGAGDSTTTLTDVAQTSGQLASGSSFTISGSSSTTPGGPGGAHMGPRPGPGGHGHFLDGTELLATTDQLLAIIDAESAGDFRGLRMQEMGGATVTNYDASGNKVSLPQPAQNSAGPEGCSFSGKQFPKFDSLLLKVAKTVIDFGSGVTNSHGPSSITRSGKITITRSGDSSTKIETITFENYRVNGATVQGTKTRVNTFDSSGGSASSSTNVVDGKIVFSDGTSAIWISTRERKSTVVLDPNNKPISGQIVTDGSTSVTSTDGTVIYSHNITKSIVENIACGRDHHGPISGTVATVYGSDTVSVDFGDGSCGNKTVTVTLNGVATSKTLGQ